jgi:hypothetical protein
MGFHMNEDYLDRLLQSILDMEEKEEETDPVAVEPLTEQPQDYPTNQPEEQGLSDYAAQYAGSRPEEQGLSDYAAQYAGSRPEEQGSSDFASQYTGNRPEEQGSSDFTSQYAGSRPEEQRTSDFAAQYAGNRPEEQGSYDLTSQYATNRPEEQGSSDYAAQYAESRPEELGSFDYATQYAGSQPEELSDLGIGADASVESSQSDEYDIESDLNRFGEVGDNANPQTSAGDIDMSDIEDLLRSLNGSSFMEDEAEDTQMSEDEIENLLRQTKESAGAAAVTPGDSEGGQDWQEIQDLLTKADQNEAVDDDILTLLSSETSGEEMREQFQMQDLFADDQAPSGNSAKKKKNSEQKEAAQRAKEEKAAKKQEKKAAKQAKKASARKRDEADPQAADDTKTQESDRETGLFQTERLFGSDESFDTDQILSSLYGESEKPAKKKGLLTKVMDFLLEEEEAEEEKKKEKPSKAKKSKSKEKTKKDNKKVKKTDNSYEGEFVDDENVAVKKKGKTKPKKEKAPKAAASLEPTVKLPLKKVIAVSSLCATIGAAILICSVVFTDYASRQSALKAYISGNFMQCYMDLYGKELNDQENLWFYRSECILRARLPLKQYQVLATRGDETEALDVLIQFVVRFPMLQAKAELWQAQQESQAAYEEVLGYLSTNYGLSEDQALTIAAEPDDLIYTQTVNRIAKGGSYQAEGAEPSPAEANPPMSDVLPEEEGLPDVTFIEGL